MAVKKIRVATQTYYLSPDKKKVYVRGEDSRPHGSTLLARKGSPVDPEVADYFGLETEEAEDVSSVPVSNTTPVADRTRGVGRETAEGYRRLDAVTDVHNETQGIAGRASQAGISQSRQVGMMREAEIEDRIGSSSPSLEERRASGVPNTFLLSGGLGDPGSPEVTRALEEGERAALARHIGSIEAGKQSLKDTPEAQPETAGGESLKESFTNTDSSGSTGGRGIPGADTADTAEAVNSRTKTLGVQPGAKGETKADDQPGAENPATRTGDRQAD